MLPIDKGDINLSEQSERLSSSYYKDWTRVCVCLKPRSLPHDACSTCQIHVEIQNNSIAFYSESLRSRRVRLVIYYD